MQIDFNSLESKVYFGLESKFPSNDEVVLSRVNYELKIIKDNNLIEYYLVFTEIIKICDVRHYLRSPGRSSAAGSLVNYCLDITKINPLENELLFERFINTKITQNTKISIDIPKGERYNLILELNKALIEFNIYQLLIPSNKENNYEKVFLESEEYYIHPCATIISKFNLNEEYKTVKINRFDYIILSENSNELESLEYFRYDILELEYLTKIQEVYSLIDNEKIHPYSLPLNDLKTFENLTTEGAINIFQFNTDSMNEFLKDFKPKTNYDLAIINACYRPLALDNLFTIIDNKEKGDFNPYAFKSKRIKDILIKNYGVLVFQEDIDILICEIAGFDMNSADYFRRVLFRNEDEKEIQRFRNLFINGCKKNSKLTDIEILEFTDLIISSSQTAFVKSHSLCYSMIAYWGIYYKTHFKNEFDEIFEI